MLQLEAAFESKAYSRNGFTENELFIIGFINISGDVFGEAGKDSPNLIMLNNQV